MHPLYSCRELIRNLILKDLKLKYRDSGSGVSLVACQPASLDFGLQLRFRPYRTRTFLLFAISLVKG
jgi:hypothetical protein